MVKIVNEYGNIASDEQREFEGCIGREVEAYLQSLLDRGVHPGEVRLVSHYLMGFIHLVESRVLLKYQMAAHRLSKPEVDKGEKRLKDLGDKLDDKIEELRKVEYVPDADGLYIVPDRDFAIGSANFDRFAAGRPYSVKHSSARRAYIFQFTDEG